MSCFPFMVLVGCVGVASFGLGAEPAGWVVSGEGGRIRVVVASGCFGEVGDEAGRVGGRLLARHLMMETGRPVEVEVGREAEEVGELLGGEDGVDVVMLTGDLWAAEERDGRSFDLVVQSGLGGGRSAWVLLARDPWDVGVVGRGHVVVAGQGNGELPMMWLDVWRRSEGLVVDPAPPTHRISREPKAGVGLLRTYFGKADACLVAEAVFAAECERNPEVARRLRRVATSPPLPGAVVAVRRAGPEPELVALRRAVARLESSAHGVALASLLGVEGFAPFVAESWPAVAAVVPDRGSAEVPSSPTVAAQPLSPPPPPSTP